METTPICPILNGNELVSSSAIDAGRLDKSSYTLSLAAEALRCQLCTEGEYNAFELGIFDRLAEYIDIYTRGESTSVESTTAVMLLGSILYNTDLALMNLPPEEAARKLFSLPLHALHDSGVRINRQLILKALSKLRALKRTRINTFCVFYNRLLNVDLEKLIRSYDYNFDAKRNFTDVDYPLPTVNRAVCGIGGILHLLDELQKENDFVNSFDEKQLGMLWNRYARELANPVGVMMNLGQLVFEHALLSLMSGHSEPTLPLSEEDARILAGREYSGDEFYYAALGYMHRLDGRAPESYLARLLERLRAPMRAVFSCENAGARERALRRYVWIYR